MSENSKLTLAAKIAKVAAEIGPIEKDGVNSQQKYRFIEYAAVAAEIRKKQAEVGIAIIPRIKSYTRDDIKTSKGGLGFHYLLSMEFEVINTEDENDRLTMDWIGEATDYGDKGINKAITSAVKYFAMRLYNISEKGEEEADNATPAMDDIVNRGPERRTPNRKVEFNEVRSAVATITNVPDLEEYWRSLGNLSDGQAKILQSIFAKRKSELIAPEAEDEPK